MKEEIFTPAPILSNQIKVFTRNPGIMFYNKKVNSELLASNIRKAFHNVTGRQIDNEQEYRSLILAIMILETGLRYHKKILPWLPIAELPGSKTDGIMQAANVANLNFYSNLVLNFQKLDKIVQTYTQNNIINDYNVKFILADWCAGKNSCKIASLQSFLNKKLSLNPSLNIDGILGEKTASALIAFEDYSKTDADHK